MKLIILLIAFFSSQTSKAVPHESFTVKEFSGVVERAVWRGSFKLERVFATPKGTPQNEWVDTVPEHWIIILKQPKGLTKLQRSNISWAYNRLPIDWHWRTFTKELQETHLYLRLSAPKDWPVKIGSTITVKNLIYKGNDQDGSFTVREVMIDGKKVKLPEKQLQPGWKNIKQNGTAQPSGTEKSKPEGK